MNRRALLGALALPCVLPTLSRAPWRQAQRSKEHLCGEMLDMILGKCREERRIPHPTVMARFQRGLVLWYAHPECPPYLLLMPEGVTLTIPVGFPEEAALLKLLEEFQRQGGRVTVWRRDI